NNTKIKTLFTKLLSYYILLLEDINAVSLEYLNTNMNVNLYQSPPKPVKTIVSLLTLLNILNGVGSLEGQLLILKTNYIERLNTALIGPSRTDMKIEFQLAGKDMATWLFHFIYNLDPENSLEGDNTEKGAVAENDRILRLANEFAAKVPEREFSQAELM
ncbi:hypothetical protein P154DRAFT_447546, partial [Amniculicola lignicola CBS 123094]